MLLTDFYLICFTVGISLSFVSFLGGSFHLPHVHLHVHHGKGGGGPLNFGTVTAFLAWFGGAGFLLTRFYSVALLWTLLAAIAAGLAGAAVIFLFLTRVLARNDKDLDPADYEMRGVLGRVSSTVRPGGTGEMIFTQQGTRRSAAIRLDRDQGQEGQAIPRDAEVVVTRYERGIAYVREFNGF